MLAANRQLVLFAPIFAIILATDIYVKLHFEAIPYRLLTKPFVVGSLLLFYVLFNKESSKTRLKHMIAALCFFLAGDIFLIFGNQTTYFTLGMACFIGGKFFYALRFSHQRDFALTKLLPFLIFCFGYVFFLISILYDKLDGMMLPVLLYFFMSVIVLQFAFLRVVDVDRVSFYLVFIGMLLSMGSDSITALKTWYVPDFFYEKVTIMLFYGISQFLVVIGVCREWRKPGLRFVH